MRRLHFILLALLAASLVAGCSKDVPVKGTDSSDDAWRYDESLPVPVEFGTSSLATKAPITTVQDLYGKRFGIFAYDKSARNLNVDDGLMMRNALAVCGIDGATGYLEMDQAWYYPVDQDVEFGFRSYYPRNNDGYEQTSTQMTVQVPVTNVHDVLWAEASVDGGYNASYLRADGPAPVFKYSHKTACLSFKACTDLDDVDVKIMFLSFVDVPTSATLCIADTRNKTNVGEFIAYSPKSNWTAKKIGNAGTGTLDCALTTTPQDLCQPTFVAPCERLTVKADVRVAGSNESNWVEFVLDPAELGAEKGDEGFLAGYHYAFNLKVIAPTKVSLTIDKQQSGAGSIFDFDDNQWENAFN